MNHQSSTWAGKFGDDYTDRQAHIPGANVAFFARALARAARPKVALELGAGSGENIRALHQLYPHMSAWALEVNEHAASQITGARVVRGDMLTTPLPGDCRPDLVFTKGVLIHVPPERLAAAYHLMAAMSSRYVLIAEYHSPTPVEVRYRDQEGLLWKRDFALEFLTAHPDFHPVDYGFAWRHDPQAPQDDLTWFLLERRFPYSTAGTVAAAFDRILRGTPAGAPEPA